MKTRNLLRTTVIAALTVLLGACGGGGGGGSSEENLSAAVDQSLASVGPAVSVRPASAALPYEIALLGDPGTTSFAVAVNNAGQVAGNYLSRDGSVNAFIWDGATFVPIAAGAQAADLSETGEVVGWFATADPHPFVYERAGDRIFRFPEAGKAYGINDLGQTVGGLEGSARQPFVEDRNALSVLPFAAGSGRKINNRGQIAVHELKETGFSAVLFDGNSRRELGTLGGDMTLINDLNEQGDAVGWSTTADGQTHAFLWRDGVMHDLGSTLGEFNSAVAINENGTVLLKSTEADGSVRILLWRDGTTVDLHGLGFDFVVPADLNDHGQIVGWLATETGELRAFLASPKTIH